MDQSQISVNKLSEAMQTVNRVIGGKIKEGKRTVSGVPTGGGTFTRSNSIPFYTRKYVRNVRAFVCYYVGSNDFGRSSR